MNGALGDVDAVRRGGVQARDPCSFLLKPLPLCWDFFEGGESEKGDAAGVEVGTDRGFPVPLDVVEVFPDPPSQRSRRLTHIALATQGAADAVDAVAIAAS